MQEKEIQKKEVCYPTMQYELFMLSRLDFLRSEIDKIDEYVDRSLFFQNPKIIKNWLEVVDLMAMNCLWIPPEFKKYYPTLKYLLNRKEVASFYEALYHDYCDELYSILRKYETNREVNCISSDAIHTLSAGNYAQTLSVTDDFTQYLRELDKKSLKARSALYDVLSELQRVLLAVMERGLKIAFSHRTTNGELMDTLNKDLKEWTRSYGQRMLREMKEDLNRHYKARRTDPYTPELWGEMLNADEDALLMASKRKLLKCEDLKQEHWGRKKKKIMEKNGELMSRLYSLRSTDELFDVAKAESEYKFISMLTEDNIELFYDIILRRHLILCEMNPKLKAQHDKWLNSSDEEEAVEEKGLNNARLSKLDEMIKILKNGKWKQPATAENIELLMNTVFGRDTSSMDDGDVSLCEKMWALIEGGSGERMLIVPANLAGFFSEENLLAGSPTEISNDLFGNGTHVNNINKGNSNRCSKAFSEVIPILRKYIDKMIRQA